MTMIADVQAVHRSNTQFCREIHAILPRADGVGGAEVPAALPLVPRVAPRNRADEFEDQDIVKGNKLRMVFNRKC